MAEKFDLWGGIINPVKAYFEDPKKNYASTSQSLADPAQMFGEGKKLALDEMTRAQDQAATQMAGQAGAAGLSGGGGRALGMQSELGTKMAQEKAKASNQYDQSLYQAQMQRAQQQLAQDQFGAQLDQQPTWIDAALGLTAAGGEAAKTIAPMMMGMPPVG